MKRLPAIFRQLLGSVTPLLVTVLVACGANNLDLATQESLTSDAGSIAQCASLPASALIGLVICGGRGGGGILDPNVPVGTAAANRDPGGIPFEEMKITWTYPAGDRTGVNFEIQRWQGKWFITLATNTADPKLYYDRNLAPGTTYTYRINAIDANGNTYSDYFSGSTLLASGSPNAPAYLTGTSVPSPLAIDLTWVDQSSNETNFLIERSVDQGTFALLIPAPGLAANIVSYRDTAISYNHTYSYRVYAKNAAGRSPNSNEVTVAIGAEPAPAAPSGLVSTFVSATQVTLQFMDNATNEDSFEVQRKPSGGSFDAIQTLSAQTGTGTVTVQDMSVSAGTNYVYRVLAKKGALFSISNELPVSTPSAACDSNGTPFGGGAGDLGNPYQICSPDQLNRIRGAYLSSSFKLEAPIDLQNQAWTPIGSDSTPFSGTFDGNGKTISNLSWNQPGDADGGLFGAIYGDVLSGGVKNVTLENVTIAGSNCTSTKSVGALAGIVNSDVTNCKAINVNITKNYGCYVGGLVGRSDGWEISESYATGVVSVAPSSVSAASRAVSSEDGTITVSGLTAPNFGSVGGLVGFLNDGARISDSYATDAVSGGSSVGGLVGKLYYGTILHSHATGAVSGTYSIGGLVGYVFGDETIGYSYATGAVSGTYTIGGLVGSLSGIVANTYATGKVTSSGGDVGGLVGFVSGAWIYKSHAVGAVSGASSVGGLVGRATGGTAENSYWNMTTSGQNGSALGDRKDDTQMKTVSTFVGWDFGRIWWMPANDYPKLQY
ncbi:MAG: GLUG motif-containing protein [Pseudomonadota bacterium]